MTEGCGAVPGATDTDDASMEQRGLVPRVLEYLFASIADQCDVRPLTYV